MSNIFTYFAFVDSNQYGIYFVLLPSQNPLCAMSGLNKDKLHIYNMCTNLYYIVEKKLIKANRGKIKSIFLP